MTAPTPSTDNTDDDTERFLCRDEVCELAGLSYVTIWDLIRRGAFPPARRISRNRVAWLQSEVIAWMRSRPVQTLKPL
jgi:predicted DNA-binding transcriptional regulator AlpA